MGGEEGEYSGKRGERRQNIYGELKRREERKERISIEERGV